MKKTQKQSWEQVRAKGAVRFVLRYGLLRQGLPFAAVMTVGRLLRDVFAQRPIESTLSLIVTFALYAVAFGGCMGTVAWRDHERDYQKPTDNDDVVAS